MISFTTITEEEKSINLGNYIQIVDLWILYGFNMFFWLGRFLIDAVTCFQLSLGNNNISCAISIVTFSVSAWCLLQLLCLSIICISTEMESSWIIRRRCRKMKKYNWGNSVCFNIFNSKQPRASAFPLLCPDNDIHRLLRKSLPAIMRPKDYNDNL